MQTEIIQMKRRATKEDKERAKRQKREEPTVGEPYQGSDGYWRRWINDGRGGYDEILPLGEQIRREWEPGR